MRASFSKHGLWLCLLFLLVLTACGKEILYQDLEERDANEILVVLYKHGIDAFKLKQEGTQEVAYMVQVPRDKIQDARRILVENNLPRKKELGFSGICKEKGLIPTPEEEKCRKLLALKGEIINSLERVPGVIDADVVLNIPEVSEFASEDQAKKRPTASAVIRVKKGDVGYDVREGNIQRFISNTVENLDPRDVTVIISYVESPQEILAKGPQNPSEVSEGTAGEGEPLATIAGLTLEQDSLKRFKIYAIVFLVVLIGISIALILNVIKLTRMRQELKVSRAQGAAGGTPLLEGGGQAGGPPLQSGEAQKAEHPAS
jgi:type III secretion protein J